MADPDQAQSRLDAEENEEQLKERLEREHNELVQELRALIPGAEVLFGFLLAIRFTEEFGRLDDSQRYVYYVTLVSTSVALVLYLATSAHHRLRFPPPTRSSRSARATATRLRARSPDPSPSQGSSTSSPT